MYNVLSVSLSRLSVFDLLMILIFILVLLIVVVYSIIVIATKTRRIEYNLTDQINNALSNDKVIMDNLDAIMIHLTGKPLPRSLNNEKRSTISNLRDTKSIEVSVQPQNVQQLENNTTFNRSLNNNAVTRLPENNEANAEDINQENSMHTAYSNNVDNSNTPQNYNRPNVMHGGNRNLRNNINRPTINTQPSQNNQNSQHNQNTNNTTIHNPNNNNTPQTTNRPLPNRPTARPRPTYNR